jgi:hypothetical protein
LTLFVARRGGCAGRVGGVSQRLVDDRGDDDGVVVHSERGGDWMAARELAGLLRRPLWILEIEGEQRFGAGLFEAARLFRGNRQVHV